MDRCMSEIPRRGAKDVCDLLGCNARQMPKFMSNILPLTSSGLKMETACTSETLVSKSVHTALQPTNRTSWLTILLRFREVPGSNIGPETGHPEVCVILLSPYRQMPRKYLKLGHDRFLSHSFQFIIHLSFHVTLFRLIYWESVVK
jgi:hypothetical protein